MEARATGRTNVQKHIKGDLSSWGKWRLARVVKLVTTDRKDGPSGGSVRKPRQFVKSFDGNFKPPRVKIKIGSVEVRALFDIGAGKSLIRTDLFKKLGKDI